MTIQKYYCPLEKDYDYWLLKLLRGRIGAGYT